MLAWLNQVRSHAAAAEILLLSLRGVLTPVLELPILYELSQRMLGAQRSHAVFMREFVRVAAGESVLDIGCGVGTGLSHIPSCDRYLGVDISADYIARAKSTYGGRGDFVCADVAALDLSACEPFSCAYAYGVMHHLDDRKAHTMFELVASKVTDRFVTIDPVLRVNEHPVARYLISHDRGRFVRTQQGYTSIASQYGSVETFVLTDLLRVPYAHLITRLSLSPTRAR
jgi:SAM-dependent methyltransferase